MFTRSKCPRCGALNDTPTGEVRVECHCGERYNVGENPQVPQEIGGTHYQQGVKTSPWDLQKQMASSGNAFVDARRADAIKYTFRMKGGCPKLLEDLKKAKHCLEAGIAELEAMLANEDNRKNP